MCSSNAYIIKKWIDSIYKIKAQQRKRAKEIGVGIQPSTKGNFKLDVYSKGRLIASVGDKRFADFATYKETKGLAFAEERRAAYFRRHQSDESLRGLLAKFLLWT